jgi:hypothetical protein
VKTFPDVVVAQKFGFPSAHLLEFAGEETSDVDVRAVFST